MSGVNGADHTPFKSGAAAGWGVPSAAWLPHATTKGKIRNNDAAQTVGTRKKFFVIALMLLFSVRGCRRTIRVLRDPARSGGNLASIRKLDGRAGRQMRTVFRAKTLDRHHVARLQSVFAPSLTVNDVRRSTLECPVHHFAVLAFHIQIKIDVRVHELHFRNSSSEREGAILVEFDGESVMRKNRRRHGK